MEETVMLKFLSSLKLAVILIAGIAVMSVLATIFPDANAFSSWSFRLLVIAFFVNLGLCTVQLLPKFWKQIHRTAADVPETADYKLYDADEAAVTAWLQENHYKISRQEQNGTVKIMAQKGKAGLSAPHLLHISLLIILIGALFSTFNTEGYSMGQVGQNRPFPDELQSVYGTDSTVEILDFQTLYDDQNAVDNWVTRFNLYIHGELVAQNVETKVNEPYRHGNLMIYQNSYDRRYLLEAQGLEDEADNTTYGIPENQAAMIGGQTVVTATIEGKPYVQISDHVNAPRGQFVEPGDVLVLTDTGATLTYLDTAEYSILELKIRRGTYIVFAGFLLASIASLLFLSGRYRELWIVTGAGQTQSRIRCHSKSSMVVEEVEEELAEHWPHQREEL
ncbi:MAG: cytochrome c biogenesis protein ResB [Peptococcaceae bacterium]|nr:cytochrome c biogenesis protein ResB [Peptococcaceae bacterium]